ncbi:hypothetical protein T484DRAFT_2528220 [Baffinella frigidus]|nr:hypothetical protein T484DRAFT_2528220 [Cryptophyta sp. CCMP2293]
MKVATEQVYNAFFSGISNGPPEQQALSSLAVTVGNTTRNALFVHNDVGDCTGCPTLTMRLTGDAADLTFTLEPFRYGVATVPVTFVSTAPWSTEGASLSLELDIIVLPVNDPPMANVPVWIGIAEDSEPLQLADFVTGITVGPANEGWQRPIFTVQSAPDTPGLLAAMEGYELGAAISSAGTLALAVASGLHGVITLTIGLRDSGGSALGGLEHAVNFPKVAHVKVFPRPRITSVTPCVGPFGAGRTVTIFGQYFGSDYTAPPTGYDQEALSITVGDEACEDVQFMSDTKILCRLPYGQGRRAVTVTLHGGTANNMLGAPLSNWSRSASLATGVEAVQVLYGGGVVSASSPSRSSLLALGPVTETATDAELLEMRTCVEWNVTESTAGTDTTVGTDATRVCTRIGWNRNYSAPTARVVSGLPTVKSIRAIAHYKGRVYLGGSFTLDDSFQHRSKFYLATWDGSQLQSVGAGLEGTLYALEPFMGGLVVAGAFLQVYPDGDTSSPGIRTGGLASWDGTRWSLVGSQPLMGVVTCAAAVGDRLYVAGRFSTVGDVRASNIAQFDGSAWTPLGTGLVSRDVWSIAANDVGVFVGGDFTIAGGVAVLNLARWDPARAEWTGMRAINGVVRALAAFGARLFVAGDFSMAGTTPVTSIAQYSAVATGDVQWVPVGAGVIGGSVFSMRKIKDCIYIGGVFSAVADTDGVKPAENVARWCVNATHRASERFDPVRGVSLPGAQVLAIAEMADEI